MKIYLFNPEHDMALASYSDFYKAPAEIIRMRDDLAALPAWYAETDDLVKVSPSVSEMFSTQCLSEGLEPWGRLSPDCRGEELSPWGWDPAVVHEWEGKGLNLPDQAQLDRIKFLSGRHCCVEILDDFKEFPLICGEAVVCRSAEEVESFLASGSEVVLKAPWSGSGRGLVRTSSEKWSANLKGWVSRILRTQGFIMAEPLYHKVVDFAMEFKMDGGLSFAGYSLFETDAHGNYKSNVLESDEGIICVLERYVSRSVLEGVKQQLLRSLAVLLGEDYKGYFGVDMMVCLVDGVYCIHPCVEINLRMNMGVVARLLYDRYVAPGGSGRYFVAHFGSDGEAVLQDCQLCLAYPSQIEKGRMKAGYFPLTPVSEGTRYQCYVIIGSSDV